MNAMFEGYGSRGPAYDEMFDGEELRPPYRRLRSSLDAMTTPDLVGRVEALQASYLDQGVTFNIGGEERAFPLDILPRVIEMDTWSTIDRGVQQRVKVLEMFLADVDDAGQVFLDGVIPREVIATSSHYHRAAANVRPANGVRVHVSGIDLIRDNTGEFRVLEDNVRVPSGVSYVMTNRRAISAALPETISGAPGSVPSRPTPSGFSPRCGPRPAAGVHRPDRRGADARVSTTAAYFEHALLARTMGVELVEGRDLECRRGRVMRRTTKGLEPVHVIYRRVDDEFLDPVHFLADSVLGARGWSTRRARATSRSPTRSATAWPTTSSSRPTRRTLIRYYLSEDPMIRNVDTWRMGEPEAREGCLDRLDELVLKPVDGSGGKGIVIGPVATRAELDELRAKVLDDPRSWIAQPVVQSRRCRPFAGRPARCPACRPAAVRGQRRRAGVGAPRRPTRVALAEGELIVNSSRGGGSKDPGCWPAPPPAVDLEGRGRPAAVYRSPNPNRKPKAGTCSPSSSRPTTPPRCRAGRCCARCSRRPRQQPAGSSHAEPDRGVDVLDRALRGARRGHRADPRRPDPADPRGLPTSTR